MDMLIISILLLLFYSLILLVPVLIVWNIFQKLTQPKNKTEPIVYDGPLFGKQDNFNPSNYTLRKTLMSPTERLFFERLRRAIGDKYDIYPQVNLDKIFSVKFQRTSFAFKAAKWAIDRRSIDFLITERNTQRPFIGIELDDSTHKREDRLIRDEKVNALFKENGISLIRFEANNTFAEEELRKLFEKHYS